MEIARRPGTCPVCGARICTGDCIEHDADGRAVHVKCAATATLKTAVRTNRHGQHCWLCGQWVPPGQGRLFYAHPDDATMHGAAGWLVEHLNEAVCKQNVRAAEEREAALAEEKRALLLERRELVNHAAALTDLQLVAADDDDRLGTVIAESAHYRAIEIIFNQRVIGFVIR